MLAMMNSAFLGCDDECSRFSGSTITLDPADFESLSVDDIPMEEAPSEVPKSNDCNKLQRLRIESSSVPTSPNDVVKLANHCGCLRELSLSYSMLSDDLLLTLTSEKHARLETMRIEAHSDTKPLPRISDEAWLALERHSPNLNIVLTSYLSGEDDYDCLLATHVPITHLYFGEDVPAPVARRIGENCPRLLELVIGSYDRGVIDEHLIKAASGCPRLSTVGLGDCEITCSGLVDFVSRCHERLRVLYVWETSLIEDSDLSVTETAGKISRLLGRNWAPEYVPPW